jgi:threonylcarbamoyladenosine tRNA methylthiotransferase MtaB
MPAVKGPDIKARATALRRSGDTAAAAHLHSQISKTHKILTESPLMGRTEHFAEVRFATPQPVGEILTRTISGTAGTHLIA